MTRLGGALVAVGMAAAVAAAPGAGGTRAFQGRVCSLVTAAAQRTAGVRGPCVQLKAQPAPNPRYVADWGSATSDHFLSVQVGGLVVTKPSIGPVLPRPPRWQGPVLVAPRVQAYYIESQYKGVANAAGKMKFLEHGYLTQIGLIGTSAALPGLMAVAKSIAARL